MYIYKPSHELLIKFIYSTINLIFTLFVVLAGKRFKKQIIFSITALYIIVLVLTALSDYHPMAISEEKISTESFDSMVGYFGFYGNFLCYVMLMAPSFLLGIFYSVTFVAAVLWLASLRGDLDNPIFISILAVTAILIIYGCTFFYILQTRELKRFFEQ